MWNKNKHHIDDEKIDRLSDELFRALEASESEINTAAESPFLFRRIRARIESEQRRLVEENNPWMALLTQFRQAIPVFALLAVVALASSLYLHKSETNSNASEQPNLVAGLPLFLQDAQDELDASLVGWQSNNHSGQPKE